MSVKLDEVKRGMYAMVRGSFGTAKPERVLVTGVDADIKNGEAGIEYSFIGDKAGGGWAYLDQVDSVMPKDCTKICAALDIHASIGDAAELNGENFVRHFNYDGKELEITYSDADMTIEVFVEDIYELGENNLIIYDENSGEFTIPDTDGHDVVVKFAKVSYIFDEV